MIKCCEWKQRINPDIWAEKYYILEKESAVRGGRYSFKYAPHARLPLQKMGDDNYIDVSLLFASQASKTTIDMIVVNWYMDMVGGNYMFFLPDEKLISFTATDRILPSIMRTVNKNSVILEKEDRKLRDNTKNIRYVGGVGRILTSTNAANRKSTPARLLILDECAEMKRIHVEEIMERSKTYELFGAKRIKSSTLMYAGDPIDLAYKTSEEQYEYYSKCPYCNEYHIDDFEANLVVPSQDKFEIDESLDHDEKTIRYARLASKHARYKCPKCNELWNNDDKNKAVQNGKWVNHGFIDKGKSAAFRCSSFVSLFVTLEAMAFGYLKAITDEDKSIYYRGWLSKIYVPQIKSTPQEDILKLKSMYEHMEIPDKTIALFGAIDVQKDHYYYSVCAVDENMDTYIIDYGRIEDDWTLEEFIICARYDNKDGNSLFRYPEAWAIDAGFEPERVYDLIHNVISYFDDLTLPSVSAKLEDRYGLIPQIIPVKGSNQNTSNAMGATYAVSKVNDGDLKRFTINTYHFKNSVNEAIRRGVNNEDGKKLFIHKDMGDDICKSLVSEIKVELVDKPSVFKFEPTTSHPFNHYWDTAVYNSFLINLFEIHTRRRMYMELEKQEQETKITQKPRVKRDYMNDF